MGRPIKTHLVNQSNRSYRPVNRSKPVTLWFLNSNLNPTGLDQFPVKPVRYTGTGARRFDWTGQICKPWFRNAQSMILEEAITHVLYFRHTKVHLVKIKRKVRQMRRKNNDI